MYAGHDSFEEYKQDAFDFLWNEIEPNAESWDETGELPREKLWPKFDDHGFLASLIPKKYGGMGLSHTEYIQLEKEWAKVSGGVRVLLHCHNEGAEFIRYSGTDEQKERFLPMVAEEGVSIAFALTEPHAGTGRDIKTSATQDGDDYVINGQKHHITNADFAEFITVVSRTENGISNIVVPRDAPGLTITEMPETMGSHGTHHCYLEFDDCRVPAENLLGTEGEGLKHTLGSLRASRLYIASDALGIAERCLEASIDWAKKRVTFDKPIAERQAVQNYLTEMATDVYTLRRAVFDAAQKLDEDGHAGVEADLCKLLAIQVNQRVTDKAMLVHGGLGYYREFPIQRLYRDARLNWLEEGTPSILKKSAANGLLNGDLPYDVSEFAKEAYNLDSYDPEAGDQYRLSYEE